MEGVFTQIVTKQNNMLIQYNEYLDKVVPFKAVRASLTALDVFSTDYNGDCRKDIYDATSKGYRVLDNYYKATNIIFRWCALTDKLATFIGKHNLTQNKSLDIMIRTAEKELQAMTESLDILSTTRDDLSIMTYILQQIPSKIRREVHIMRNQYKTNKKQKNIKERTYWSNLLEGAIDAIIGLATYALKYFLVDGPFALFFTLSELGIPKQVINGSQIPSEEESFNITETYTNALIKVIQDVWLNVTKAENKVQPEIADLQKYYDNIKTNQGAMNVNNRYAMEPLTETEKQQLVLLQENVKQFMNRN
uniref:Uncharacterized protein n=2 Tax=Cacopsylla melanoneura TaxID=428564 RepID=A0A8D8UJ26_9HEMI